MQSISDIRIVGIDEMRPPRVRKEPYIDLFFQLSHQAPKDWCEDFNMLTGKLDPAVRINKVRDMDQIAAHLDKIKKTIIDCSEQYIERIRQCESAAVMQNTALLGDRGEQGRLNTIVATLHFGD
jgi:hypothetical protein